MENDFHFIQYHHGNPIQNCPELSFLWILLCFQTGGSASPVIAEDLGCPELVMIGAVKQRRDFWLIYKRKISHEVYTQMLSGVSSIICFMQLFVFILRKQCRFFADLPVGNISLLYDLETGRNYS